MSEAVYTSPEQVRNALVSQCYLLTGFLSNLLRRRFAVNTSLPSSIGRLRYAPEVANRTIEIGTRDEIKRTDWQLRPSIIIRRNSLTTKNLGIDEGKLVTFGNEVYSSHNTLYVGSHTVLCLSKTEAESELIALDTHLYINRFQAQIRKALCLLRIRVNDIGQTGLLKEDTQVFATPFTIFYAYDQPFVRYPITPNIRFINVNSTIG
jgi:hypothetical protein